MKQSITNWKELKSYQICSLAIMEPKWRSIKNSRWTNWVQELHLYPWFWIVIGLENGKIDIFDLTRCPNGNETYQLIVTHDKWLLCPFYFTASLLKGLKHANIVLLHDIIHTKETLTLVFEYVVSKLSIQILRVWIKVLKYYDRVS